MTRSFSFPRFWVLTLLTSILFLSACNQKNRKAKAVTESISNYVYAYTSGIISKKDAIRIRFTNEVVTEEEVGTTTSQKLFSFSPSISGTTSWEDQMTLIFEPSEMLPSATSYLGTLNLQALFSDAKGEDQSFEFEFRTKEQFFNVEVAGFNAVDPKDLSLQELKGKLLFADFAKDEEVEQLLTAKQNGKALNIRWEHLSGTPNHDFIIENIKREKEAGSIDLSWNGKALGLKEKGDLEVEVPGLNEFKVTDAKVYQSPQQYISLFFSDPLKDNQNLEGLVSIQGYSGDLRFTIDGNKLLIYPASRLGGKKEIRVSPGVKNSVGASMAAQSVWQLQFQQEKPQVKMVSNGVILPNSDGLVFPFEAINLNAVLVEVFKIYDNNILQFLQSNDLNGDYRLEQVGRVVYQEKVSLKALDGDAITTDWHRYALDLSDLIEKDPKAIYQIRIGFKPGYSNYFCGDSGSFLDQYISEDTDGPIKDEDGDYESIWSGWYGLYGYYDGYDYSHRNNPCYPAYYSSNKFVRRNVIASNLGIIAKKGNDKSVVLAVTDIRTAKPVAGAKVNIYDYQQQLLKTVTTDGNGLASAQLDRNPFVAIANSADQTGYLKLRDGNSNSLSRFSISGVQPQKGLKGYIYGERGVWRPGDSLYLHFVLEDKAGTLPGDYPITLELYDPNGQLKEKRTTAQNVKGVYPIYLATTQDAPTGNWRSVVKVGGASFYKYLKIETIKPNRLKTILDIGKDELTSKDEPVTVDLQVNWLHGAPGQNLRTVVEYQLSPIRTKFDQYGDFVFDDPARNIYSEPKVLFDGPVDGSGKADFEATLLRSKVAPGKLKARFKTRAFEKGGDFSTNSYSFDYSPFSGYVGVAIPTNKYGSKRIEINQTDDVEIAVVDESGKPIKNRQLKAGLYRVNWRWWWDSDEDYLSDYASANHYNALETIDLKTDGKGNAKWGVKVTRWGRYMVRVCDEETGHCTGDFFYAGYPWYDEDGGNRDGAAMLAFNSSKKKYKVGETVELRVPASADSRVLITLENGTKVIKSFWEDAIKGDNTFRFEATSEMTPNIYAHVSLIQPHAQTENDLPIRMYGVLPITVEDPQTMLEPKIAMSDELAPEKEFTVEVSETNGKGMAYTLAIVDDGLLDLTNFKTPNPWDAFYAKEALGVQTYDVYNNVIGAYGSSLERLLSIGGDDAVDNNDKKDQTANRFKPVVLKAGPFYLKPGEKVKHTFTMPNYVGSVRTMLVASSDGAYGADEKTTPVKQPLMILATLPRVLGPGEQLSMPIAVFAMDKKVKNVNLSVKESSGLIKFPGGTSQTLNFSKMGEKMAYFNLDVEENIGVAKFTVTANGNGFKASQDIELYVRNPNPFITEVIDGTVKGNENWTGSYIPMGMKGTNEAILEVSSLPPFNLGRRLNYLLRYPYGCIEQTTSSVFPQLYVDEVLDLGEEKANEASYNIQAGINRLKSFQTQEGGFAYWPGETEISEWGSNYGGHFILEAEKLGYNVPASMINRWKKAQNKLANSWRLGSDGSAERSYSNYHQELTQAYRLYTLALAKSPNMGAMNRLRESGNLAVPVRWRLAAAYALAGQKETATKLIEGISTRVDPYDEMGGSFGSSLRDQAMFLETMVLLDRETQAAQMVKEIADQLEKSRWYSTQTTAYSLLAIGKYIKQFNPSKQVKFSYQIGAQAAVNAGSEKPVFQATIPADASSDIKITNASSGLLYIRIVKSGQPVVGTEVSAADHMQLSIQYKDTQGNTIDPTTLPQGTDFIAQATITHLNVAPYRYYFEQIALHQIFPSGWEIINSRMDEISFANNDAQPTYQDFRDDRVYTFFNLRSKRTKVFNIRLNAAYQGRYYMPAVKAEAMYNDKIKAIQPGEWVEVTAPIIN